MVAKTPPRLRRMAPLNPNLLRETLKKVDQCMARLQELQYTVSGGAKVVSGKNLSPRSTRGYLRTSVRCKQESLRMKNSACRKSPVGKFRGNMGGDWQRMSLPAMLVGETVVEILQASHFALDIVAAVEGATKQKKFGYDDPRTPVSSQMRKKKASPGSRELVAKRKREKQVGLQKIRMESDSSPTLGRGRSRINFKVSPNKREVAAKDNWHIGANRVSPRNKPWAKMTTVLFPNPLFHSSPAAATHQHNKFSKTSSPPVIASTRHKFFIKSPTSNSKFQVKIKNPAVVSTGKTKLQRSLSPPSRATSLNKKSLKVSTATKLRRSLSPAKLANRFASPLSMGGGFMIGLKQRPSYNLRGLSDWRV